MASHDIDPAELQLDKRVGTGSTAEVFRATFRGQVVAVKIIDWGESRIGVKEQLAFQREVSILSGVQHVNLVRFIGISPQARPLRIVTEFCYGGSVYTLLHDSEEVEISWTQNLVMVTQVASAVYYLHSFDPQIIHRDLKSLNLLLLHEIQGPTDQPTIKLTDFGLSRIKNQGADDAEWGYLTVAAGTYHWMAPEVFRGDKYDESADVYSYAMILFEVFCREIPFIDEELESVCRLAAQGERPDLEAVPPDCPRDLRKLMISCWSMSPDERPKFNAIMRILSGVALNDRAGDLL